ncbi:MAG: UvrD-helicase domain-containing protein, partial [Myxococcota bacterium]|nr:UvrD-helicase domain-containing protein [Myxococcota bacterium]
SFTIYDDSDQKAMVNRCLKALELDEKKFPPRSLQNEINRSKQAMIGPDEYPRGDFYRERIQKVYELYEKKMREAKALDFGDLLYRMVKAMRTTPAVQSEVAGRFDYVLVDEFQDTNQVQLELVRRLSAPHGNVCVVGDDDQSIYSWRGADVTNILDFEKHFPGATAVTLDRNYRSTGNILKASHAVVSRLVGRRSKQLWTTAPDGELIDYLESEDEREEARAVAKAVRELDHNGFPLGDQAVFYRTNAQSRVFEEVFRTLNIPHRVVGGMRFYERAEVKDVLSFLRLIQNTGDLAALVRIINTPTRGIGKTTVDKLLAVAAGLGVSGFDAITLGKQELGNAHTKLEAFRAMVEAWRAEIDLGPAHLAKRVLADTGYTSGLEVENSAESDARLENLQELIGSIEDFEREAETPNLCSFLELVALQSDVDAAKFDGQEVTLMTVHAAKGLEFDVVHVTGLEDGLFPYKQGSALDSTRDEQDEERRLCYVAMTRARKRLFLHRARVRRLFGQPRFDPPSRFLCDIPPEVIRDITRARPSMAPLSSFVQRSAESTARPVSPRPGSSRDHKQTGLASLERPMAPPGRSAANKDETWVDRSFEQTTGGADLLPGRAVRHARFGVGKILEVMAGPRPKVDVQFPGFGRKTILVEYLELD